MGGTDLFRVMAFAAGIAVDAIVYALDATTIHLCLSSFDWALIRSTQGAVKMHTLLDFARLYKAHQTGAFFVAWGENARRVCWSKTYRTRAASTYVLIAIVKKELHRNTSLYTLLQILPVSLLILFDL